MLLQDLIDDVQDLLEDPNGSLGAFPDAKVSNAAESACRFLGNSVGRNTLRFALDMTVSVSDYVIPTANKVRRINQIKILPDGGGEPRGRGLIQIDLLDMPIVADPLNGQDPDRFVLNLTGGSAENQYSLSFYPVPYRTALASIYIDAEIDYVFAVADQATTNIAYPEQFAEAIKFLTCYYLLFTKDNALDQNQAVNFKAAAVEIIEMNRPVDAVTKYTSNRMFP